MKQLNDRIASADAWSPWQEAAVASSRGACSRSCGETSVGNPYLHPRSLPAATGQEHATWFNNCDSWWRGWDTEDTRLRALHAGGGGARSAARALRRNEASLAKR
jgi:hypothetical protein